MLCTLTNNTVCYKNPVQYLMSVYNMTTITIKKKVVIKSKVTAKITLDH